MTESLDLISPGRLFRSRGVLSAHSLSVSVNSLDSGTVRGARPEHLIVLYKRQGAAQ